MNNLSLKEAHAITMKERGFNRLSEFISAKFGIKMPASKKTMLESRLLKRVHTLGLNSFEEYCDYLFSHEGMAQEIVSFIDIITTHKTDFFREPDHFDYLLKTALPQLTKMSGYDNRKRVTLWSAGCSTGEEAYTLAMVLSEFAAMHPEDRITFSILATDISEGVLDIARCGIYEEDRIAPIPMDLKKKYLLRSKERVKSLVRIIPELRSFIKFRRLNLIENNFGIHEPIDIIFCRNVVIYFDRNTLGALIDRFCRHLSPNGYLFMGHSETLNGFNFPLVQAAPTIYRKAS